MQTQRSQYHDLWDNVKKWAALITAITLWIASMQFSYAGFNVNAPEAAWLGWVLAFAITVIELVFNTDVKKLNLTLYVVGFLAYAYGIWTNVVGFYFSVQGMTWATLASNPLSIVFAIVLGFFLEVTPEALFIWGLGSIGEGDVLGNILKAPDHMDTWTKDKPQPIQKSKFLNLTSPASLIRKQDEKKYSSGY